MAATAAPPVSGELTRLAAGARPLTARTRRLLIFLAALAAIAGGDLFFATEATERYFAWTIQSHLTAASLGAAYLGSVVLLLLSARVADWAAARVGAVSAQTLIALILVAMVVHIDRFHTGADEAITFFATWSFIGTYVVVPPLVLLGLVSQVRTEGGEPPRTAPLPAWYRAALGGQGAVLATLGAALVLAPSSAGELWPWSLTPLTGRAAGAFLVAIGLGALLGVRENDWRRIRPAVVAYTAFACLELIALARYSGEVSWDSGGGWVYLAVLAAVLCTGVYGTARALRT